MQLTTTKMMLIYMFALLIIFLYALGSLGIETKLKSNSDALIPLWEDSSAAAVQSYRLMLLSYRVLLDKNATKRAVRIGKIQDSIAIFQSANKRLSEYSDAVYEVYYGPTMFINSVNAIVAVANQTTNVYVSSPAAVASQIDTLNEFDLAPIVLVYGQLRQDLVDQKNSREQQFVACRITSFFILVLLLILEAFFCLSTDDETNFLRSS